MDEFGKVAVLMGGNSSEREVSLQSGQQIIDALVKQGVDASAVDPANDDLTILNDFSRVFIALHGGEGEDGTIQGYLETIGIPYTGSGILASAICMDKLMTKRIWNSIGLATPPGTIWSRTTGLDEYCRLYGLPLAIKPVSSGSSLGVSKVSSATNFDEAIDKALQYCPKILIEPWITGDEFSVPILGGKPLPTIQIVPNDVFYNYDAKYLDDKTKFLCPSELNSIEEQLIQRLALDAFSSVGATSWGRVDIIRDLQGDFWLLEVNTVPGMTSHSLLPQSANQVGMSYEQVILEILSDTLVPKNHSFINKKSEKSE